MYYRRPLCRQKRAGVVNPRAFADPSSVAIVMPADMPCGYCDMPRGYFAARRPFDAFPCNHGVMHACDASASRTSGDTPTHESASIYGLQGREP
jgi:hypothetical protein